MLLKNAYQQNFYHVLLSKKRSAGKSSFQNKKAMIFVDDKNNKVFIAP